MIILCQLKIKYFNYKMGQYYFIIFLDESYNFKFAIDPLRHKEGVKLTEHSYFGSELISTILILLSNNVVNRVVWAGDYADVEEGTNQNLYNSVLFDLTKFKYIQTSFTDFKYKYLLNNTKKLYVNLFEEDPKNFHPLPILTVEGNGRGGGDYNGNNMELVGSWARDIISTSNVLPEGYTLVKCNFENK